MQPARRQPLGQEEVHQAAPGAAMLPAPTPDAADCPLAMGRSRQSSNRRRLPNQGKRLENAVQRSGRPTLIGILVEQHRRIDRGPWAPSAAAALSLPSQTSLCMRRKQRLRPPRRLGSGRQSSLARSARVTNACAARPGACSPSHRDVMLVHSPSWKISPRSLRSPGSSPR